MNIIIVDPSIFFMCVKLYASYIKWCVYDDVQYIFDYKYEKK